MNWSFSLTPLDADISTLIDKVNQLLNDEVNDEAEAVSLQRTLVNKV